MNSLTRLARLESVNARAMLKLGAVVGLASVAPPAVRALAPVVLTVAEILLGIGQACVTFLRACGV